MSTPPSQPGLDIVWRTPPSPRPELSHLVFDFDGTLSWLRHGWPGMMCDVFLENDPNGLLGEPQGVRGWLLGEILALNGKPSIFQCQRFADILQEHGGPKLEAEPLRVEFQRRLDDAIAQRIARVRSGEAAAEGYVVHGARAFLEQLAASGRFTLAILSTTTQHRVVEEAELLGIHQFFGRHIYGGTGDPLLFSKRAAFDRLLLEENCPGARLLSFGDGPVELRETKELGGVAIAVCSDEEVNGSGVLDPHKRDCLFAAGADAAIPDYREAGRLMEQLLGRPL